MTIAPIWGNTKTATRWLTTRQLSGLITHTEYSYIYFLCISYEPELLELCSPTQPANWGITLHVLALLYYVWLVQSAIYPFHAISRCISNNDSTSPSSTKIHNYLLDFVGPYISKSTLREYLNLHCIGLQETNTSSLRIA